MADDLAPALPRIALIFGDADAAAHLRDAMVGCADIAYAAAAREFDPAQLREAQVAAVLVNVDGGDWLDGVEEKLAAVSVPAVFNDPDISRGLEGWERARWLRHLLAKLRGCNRDVDPPRPQAAVPSAPIAAAAAFEPDTFTAQLAVTSQLQPLPPEAVTINMVEPESSLIADVQPTAITDDAAWEVDVSANDNELEFDGIADAAPTAASAADVGQPPVAALPAAPREPEFDAESGLDVDTEALSAMIDARLAEPDAQQSNDSPEVWRVVSGGKVSPVNLDTEIEIAAPTPAATTVAPTSGVASAPAKDDGADMLASLPSLDDWALVDPDDASAAVSKTSAGTNNPDTAESLLSDAFAGLELVPMETIIPLNMNADPIERWMDSARAAKVPEKAAKTGTHADHKP